jgi:hypothetical protein
MNVKSILSAFVFLAVVTSPVAALADEPAPHDHQAIKTGNPSSSGSTKHAADNECDSTQAQGAGDDKANQSQESKKKCVPKKQKNDQKHDHAKSKNL